MSSVFRIRHTTDQETLRIIGPVIPGIFGTASIIDGVVTIVSNDRLVRGNLLLDTGAASSAIDESIAEQLQLPSLSDTVRRTRRGREACADNVRSNPRPRG